MMIVTDLPQVTPDGFALGRWPHYDPRNYRLGAVVPEVAEKPLAGRRGYQCMPGVNQWKIPKCTGSSARNKLSAGPVMGQFPDLTDDQIYAGAQQHDEWPGENYAGSSLLGVGRYMKAAGYWDAYAFSNSIEEIARFMLAGKGGVLLGIEWRRGMARVDERGFIHPTGVLDGYHAIYAPAAVWGGAPNEGHLWAGAPKFLLQQSWDPARWGFTGPFGRYRRPLGGFCWIDAEALAPLVTPERYGEAMTEIEKRKRVRAA